MAHPAQPEWPQTAPGDQPPQFEDVQDVLGYQLGRALTRRGMLAGSGATLAALLAACSSGGSYTDKQQQQQGSGSNKPTVPVKISKANIPTPREQTVIVAQVDYEVFNSWNGLIPNGAPSGAGFDSMVKEAMFYLNLATGEMIPWLAKSYSYNADKTELTFVFDPAVTWNDGTPMTSDDFKWTVDLLRKRKDLLGGGGDLTEFVKAVTTPDAHTAVIELTKPNPRFHYGFICVIAGGFDIRPKHIWADKDPTKFRDNPPVRTGPYMLDKAIRSQNMFVWKKNPNYWAKDRLDPKPNYVIYTSTAKQADAAALAFEQCQFDVGSIDEEHAAQLRAKGYPALITTQFHDPCPRAFWINNAPARGVISEPKMHWAISYLVDRTKIGTNVWPVKVPPAQYPWADYPSNQTWTDQTVASQYPLTYDPAKAAQLIDEIAPKNSDGKRMYNGKPASIEIITPVPVDGYEYIIAGLLKTELGKIGMPTTLRSLSGSVHDEKFQRGEFDVSSNWVCDVSNDPEQLYRNMESNRAVPVGTNAVNRNVTRLKDPALDALSEQLANLDPTSAEAKPLLQQALQQYFQRLPVVPTIQTGYPSYFNTTFWKGWPTDQDLYQVPLNWWGQFQFVLGKLEPTGQKEPT